MNYILLHKTFLFTIYLFFLTQIILVHGCINFSQSQRRCNACPQGTHLFKGNCLYDIDHCTQYYQGLDCEKCQKGYKLFRNIDRIQCKALLKISKDQCYSEQADYQLILQSSKWIDNDQKLQFYKFLNSYITQKYQENNISSQLVKIIDRNCNKTTNDEVINVHDIVLYYKTPNTVEMIVSTVIGQYKSFQLRQIVPANQSDISDDQIIMFEQFRNGQNQKLQSIQKLKQQHKEKQKDKLTKNNQNQDEIKDSPELNFQYIKPETRQNDIGFQTSDQYLKLSNTKIIDEGSKVVGCFVKSLGLRKQYRLFYKTSSQQIYQGEVIYDIVKRKAFIMSFGKQFTLSN